MFSQAKEIEKLRHEQASLQKIEQKYNSLRVNSRNAQEQKLVLFTQISKDFESRKQRYEQECEKIKQTQILRYEERMKEDEETRYHLQIKLLEVNEDNLELQQRNEMCDKQNQAFA